VRWRKTKRPERPKGGKRTLLRSFNHAFEGLVHAARYQRNMRIHLVMAFFVLLAAMLLNVTRFELIAVIVTVCLVLITEMINSAVEAVVDIITSEFDPRAKIAKDVAAGAVLVAAINALIVAYLIFADKFSKVSLQVLAVVRRSPTHLTFVAFALVLIAVIVIKASRGRASLLSGGLPSGHAALAFAGWTAVTFVSASERTGILVSAITFIIAILVVQSRIEGGIHSLLEAMLGAILGMVITVLIFQLWF
jgi:diacylglycerol kinase (ATP)